MICISMNHETAMQLKQLVGRCPIKMILKFHPSVGEGEFRDISASIGFSFTEREVLFIGTDTRDEWTPVLLREEMSALPEVTKVTEFRPSFWVVETEEEADYRYLDVSGIKGFKDFIGDPIGRIELIGAEEAEGAFGVRISSGSSCLMSAASGTGNTIEVNGFNEGILDVYAHFGAIRYVDV